jgi:ribonucleoside-diphosphate reductase alpha chain
MFLEMRKPTGDQNMRCLNLHHGINVTDDFMKIIERCMLDPKADDRWELKNPGSSEVKEVVSAKELWQRILETRMQTGEPYIHFIDTANRALPQFLKDKGLKIQQSNLCIEIELPTNEERTAVCCLSSLNLELFDDWKDDTLFIKDVAEMLDNVLSFFIKNAPDEISRAKYSALMERSIGIGALGFHAYLQKNSIPFENFMAKSVNMKIFSHIKEMADKASLELGQERGEAPDAKGTGKRFSHTMAVAPNACVTGDTEIIMSNGSVASFEDIGTMLGIDMDSFEMITIDTEDGRTIEIHIGAPLSVNRDGDVINIIAAELLPEDEIICFLEQKNL